MASDGLSPLEDLFDPPFNHFRFSLWSKVYVSSRKTASNLLRDLNARSVFGSFRWTYKRRMALCPEFSVVTTWARNAVV